MAACHLFHDVEDSDEEKRNIRIFNYVTTDGKHFQSAVADAVQIAFKEEEDKVELRSKPLGYRYWRYTAWLKPERGEVTLVVVNLPRRHGRTAHSDESYPRTHSDVFFNLLKESDGPRSVRILADERRRVEPGSCEDEISELDKLVIAGIRELPHSVTACDGTRFPKPQ